MENNNRNELFVTEKYIVYPTSKDVAKLDADLVVRLYKHCDSIGEGLLG